MATATILLPIQGGKIGGSFITNGAQIDGGAGAWKMLFDATTEEESIWQFRMPGDYASGPVSKIQYAMASAEANTVAFDISIMAVADGEDIDSDSFDTVNSTTAITVPGTAGLIDSISTALSNADSVSAGELVLVKLARDVALDTATGDAELLTFSIEYTTS